MLKACFARFLRDEDGAVTVDWVALAGAMVGLGVLIVLDIANDATVVSTKLGTDLNNTSISDITYMVTPSGGSSGTGSSGSVSP
jgi:Flp pilus assembly pilin Flp